MAGLLMPSTYRTDLPLLSRNKDATRNLAAVCRLSEHSSKRSTTCPHIFDFFCGHGPLRRAKDLIAARKAVVNLLRVL